MSISCKSGATSRPVFRSRWWWEEPPWTVPPPSFWTNSGRWGRSLDAKSTSTFAVAVASAWVAPCPLVFVLDPFALLPAFVPDILHASARERVTLKRSPWPSPTAITLGWCEATIGAKATTSGSKLSTVRW